MENQSKLGFMNDQRKFSFAAVALAAFILLITFLTAVIATPSFLNRIHSTILIWQLPLVTIGLIVLAAMTEKEDKLAKLFRLIALGALVIGFFCTNITKNTVQDTVSNISNYVDVAKATIEHEAENIEEYGRSIEHAINRAERDMRDRYEDDWEEEW
jgi:hypothetical protein